MLTQTIHQLLIFFLFQKWRLLFDKVIQWFKIVLVFQFIFFILKNIVLCFFQYDPEGFGEIPIEDFFKALRSAEWRDEIPSNKRDILYLRAKETREHSITFQDFVNVVSFIFINLQFNRNQNWKLQERMFVQKLILKSWHCRNLPQTAAD